MNKIHAAKGKKVVTFDLKKEKPDKAVILQHIMGPTGNLRAPTLRRGKTLMVGFNDGIYSRMFG